MQSGDRPRVSVILAVGAFASSPEEALASCLSETAVELEVLVIHDGSAGGELQALGQGEPRVRVFAHPAEGAARALGLGVALARGEWIKPLAPQEVLIPGALARQLEVASRNDVAGVLAPAEALDPSGQVIEASRAPGGEPAPRRDPTEERSSRAELLQPAAARGALLDALFSPHLLPGGGALLRRSAVVRAGGFDPTLRFALHLDLWLRLLAEGDLVLERVSAVRDPWRGVGAGGREPEAARLERSGALVQALSALSLESWFPDLAGMPAASARADRSLELARRIVASGLTEAMPFAIELAARARELGAEVPHGPLRASLGRLAPALVERSPRVSLPAARPAARDTWLRVGLEVRSLDRGGLENAVVDLARGLREQGIEPIVVCTETRGARAEELRADAIEVVVLGGSDRAGELAALLEARDVHLLNPHFSTLGIPVAAALGIPVVPTLHNAYAWVGASVLDEMRRLDPLVDGYTAVSSFVADFCARRFAIAPGRIAIIPNAHRVHDGAPALDRASARAELGLPLDVELVLQIGRIDPIKCQLALVEAIERLAAERPGLVAWIAGGTGDVRYRARVEERIAAAGLGERIRLIGERSDVPRLLAAADVFAMPSVLEGLSLAVIEALAAGVPAVLTSTGDAASLLGDARPDGVRPGETIDGPAIDPRFIDGEALVRIAASEHPPHGQALAEAIARVLDDLPRRRDAARVRARELAAELAPERVFANYARVFGRFATEGALRRAGALAEETTALAAEMEIREEEASSLRGGLTTAAQGLAATLAMAREHERAIRAAGALAQELSSTQHQLAATRGVMAQALDKLRIGHRLRGGWRALGERLRGGAPR